MSTKTEQTQIKCVVSDDRYKAWLELPNLASPGFKPPDESQIVAALTEHKLNIDDSVKQRIQDYLQLLNPDTAGEGPAEIPPRFLIAEGAPPVDAKHGRYEWAEEYSKALQDWQGDAKINYYSANSVITVNAGREIGRISPPKQSIDGRDVFGKEIAPRVPLGEPIRLGDGLKLSESDPAVVVTNVAGRLEEQDHVISMKELLQVNGDVDFNSGNVDSVIDVHVGGDVKPKFLVRSTKSITITGAVDAAEIDAGMDIQVRGGLFGKESDCVIKAGRNIAANLCVDVKIVAGGDIAVAKESHNSNLHAHGMLLIEHGSLIGGEVYARAGARIRHVGTEAGVPTRIAVGVDGATLYRSQLMETRIRKSRKQAAEIQARVEPLIRNIKRLTPAQREQATELIARANEMEFAADDLDEKRKQMVADASPKEPAFIELTGVMHPGAVIVFGLREVSVRSGIKGSLKIEERNVKGSSEIVMVNPLTGSIIPLPSTQVDVGRFKAIEAETGDSDGNRQS